MSATPIGLTVLSLGRFFYLPILLVIIAASFTVLGANRVSGCLYYRRRRCPRVLQPAHPPGGHVGNQASE